MITPAPTLLRTLPVVVPGMPFDGTPQSAAHIVEWAGERAYYREGELVIRTSDGPHVAYPGEWVLEDPRGFLYPVHPDVVAVKYEQLGEGQ